MSLPPTLASFDPAEWFPQLTLPAKDSHKGQNGKLLIIGGSGLFHSASKWSLDVASKFVDMVFYASTPENNELVQVAKGSFWNGIVIESAKIPIYAQEADVILIGPGMERTTETTELTNGLLRSFPDKKWVVDAGALQMANPRFFTAKTIITPHRHELLGLAEKLRLPDQGNNLSTAEILAALSEQLPCTMLCKGETDLAVSPQTAVQKIWQVTGGNAGMTKGGTGDVLAGLIAALYCNHDATIATLIGSYTNKATGDVLFTKVGPFFNATDLVAAIPTAIWQAYSRYSLTSGK